ncbi:ribonuclease H-like domain-containing protein, partial [Tanacetum coccineum]
MTGNKDFLTDYQELDGGFVAFGRSARGGKITGKEKIKTDNVLFTETECLVLSPDFKLLDESQVLLRVFRQSNMFNFDLKNVVLSGDLTCLFVKATIDKSKLWHRRLGHVNFKTMNKLVKGNLIRGLPSKILDNDHTCVASQNGKKVEENLHVNFLENKPNIAGQGPNWLFDIDSLTNSMNYQPVTAGNQTTKNAGPQEDNGDIGLKKRVDAKQSEEKN